MKLEKKLNEPIFEIEAVDSSANFTSTESAEQAATSYSLHAMKTIHNAFFASPCPSLPPLTCEKIDSGFHYYKDKHSGDLECFEIEAENTLSRIVFQEKDNALTIYKLKEKRTSKELNVSYRSRLSLLEAKEKIDSFLAKIKDLVGYKNLEEAEKLVNLRIRDL